jgi:hypothetical protein
MLKYNIMGQGCFYELCQTKCTECSGLILSPLLLKVNSFEDRDKTLIFKYLITPQTCMGLDSWPTQTMEFVFGWHKDTVAYNGNKIQVIHTPSLYQETQMELIPHYLVSTVDIQFV